MQLGNECPVNSSNSPKEAVISESFESQSPRLSESYCLGKTKLGEALRLKILREDCGVGVQSFGLSRIESIQKPGRKSTSHSLKHSTYEQTSLCAVCLPALMVLSRLPFVATVQ